MTETVTPANEELYRKQYAATSGHSMQCIKETVTTMSKVMAGVVGLHEMPTPALHKMLKNIAVETFEKHLTSILESKDCDCK